MNTLGNPSPVTGPHSAVAPVHERRTVVGSSTQTQRGGRTVSTVPRPAVDRSGHRSMNEPKIQHHSLRARLKDFRSLGLSVGFSALMHALFFVVLAVGSFDVPEANIAFDPSQGVALFNRLGIEYGDEEADDVDEIDPEVLAALVQDPEDEEDPEKVEEPKPDEDPASDDPDDDATTDDEVAAAAPDEDPEPAPQPAPEPEPSDEGDPVAVPTPAPDPDPTPAPDPTPTPDPDESETETAANDRPRRENLIDRIQNDDDGGEATEPPSVRYPEGTLHPVATDVSMWGPDAARLTVILRNDRFRTSAHRRSMEQILGGLPDWQNLAGGANIDPFDDVDAMLIASSDPRYVSRTFLAAVHHMDPTETMARLAGGFPAGVAWTAQNGRVVGEQVNPELCRGRPCDPRVFFVPTDNLFVFARPEYVPDLMSSSPSADGLEGAVAYANDPQAYEAALTAHREGTEAVEAWESEMARIDREYQVVPEPDGREGRRERRERQQENQRIRRQRDRAIADLGERPPEPPPHPSAGFEGERVRPDRRPPRRSRGWVTGLQEIADFGGQGNGGPALMLSANGFSSFELEGVDIEQPPEAVHLNVYLESDPRLTVRFQFASRADAEAWVEAWPALVATIPGVQMVGLLGPLQAATWEIDHNEAHGTMVMPRRALEQTAATIAALNAARHGR